MPLSPGTTVTGIAPDPLLGGTTNSMTQPLCIFNKTRESFLTLGVTVADTHFSRLKGLLGKTRLRADEALWTIPSRGIHTFFLLFPIDVLYLDSSNRVVYAIENLASFRIGPIRGDAASVLQLPTLTIYSSQTEVGDQLLICEPGEIQKYLQMHDRAVGAAAAGQTTPAPAPEQ